MIADRLIPPVEPDKYYAHIAAEFKEAYTELFKNGWFCTVPRSAIGPYAIRRAVEEYNNSLTVHGCVHFVTAKETLWLVEAAQMLCTGEFGTKPAVLLIKKVLESLRDYDEEEGD